MCAQNYAPSETVFKAAVAKIFKCTSQERTQRRTREERIMTSDKTINLQLNFTQGPNITRAGPDQPHGGTRGEARQGSTKAFQITLDVMVLCLPWFRQGRAIPEDDLTTILT